MGRGYLALALSLILYIHLMRSLSLTHPGAPSSISRLFIRSILYKEKNRIIPKKPSSYIT